MDKKIQEITKEIIKIEANNLNQKISNNLRLSRNKALQKNKKFNFAGFWIMPTTALAALAAYMVLPLLLTNKLSVESHDVQNISIVSDMEVIEQLELAEDLEFYEWLSSEENISSI